MAKRHAGILAWSGGRATSRRAFAGREGRSARCLVLLAVTGVLAVGAAVRQPAWAGTSIIPDGPPPVNLVSVGIHGVAGNAASGGAATNENGNSVVFYSDATDLVAGDTNQARDVFVRDISGNTTQRVSVSSAGAQANRGSHSQGGRPAISGDGKIVAFYSGASNLVSGDTNGQADVFVRNLITGVTERVSVATGGAQANGPSLSPSLSRDGRYVAFQSQATNLVPNDGNNVADVFVHDRVTGTTERVCDATVESNRASFSPAISPDGRFVAFSSGATNLVPDDTNKALDIFVCDRTSGTVERVSLTIAGAEANGDSILPAISENGTVVGFKSYANNLVPDDRNNIVDVFVRDRGAGTTERISVNTDGGNSNDLSFPPSLSDNGLYVAFGSFATNLVAGDSNASADVFVRNRLFGVTVLIDKRWISLTQYIQANAGTPDIAPSISGDGTTVAYVSYATNLAPGDANGVPDVYSSLNDYFNFFIGGCPNGDIDCPPGEICVDGFCEPEPTPVPPTPTGTPTLTRTPTKTPTPTPTFKVCTTDADCPDGQHCRAGYCKKERPCDDNDPTIDRLACFPREACINDLCECGGDCNVDGIVFGNEITKGVLVLGGQPLGLCQAADIDGDGHVMGNEITLAVINLSQGCVQEGQPLLFSHDRGGMVTLTVGSTTSTEGGTATISVDMSGGQGEVSTAQIDLLFDPAALEVDSASSACTKNARLTAQVFSATLPNTPPPPAGLQRLRLFVGDIAPPVATFADGPLFSCTFRVKTGAAGATSVLGADLLNVGDFRGDVFGSRAVVGGVTIVAPTPAPVPVETPRPLCAGDCDGNGQVYGNEVTVAVRIMAGLLPLQECPSADADGDGRVLVTDVTRTVLNAVRGCPQ